MKILKIATISFGVLVVISMVLVVTGLGGRLAFMAFTSYNKPAGEFSASDAVEAPNYSDTANWAALPTMDDPADLVPGGVEVPEQGELPVDVFFIHPTGYLTTAGWTSPMDVNSGTEENTRWMMANQASAYNGCCNIYAPRYREANIFAYFGEKEKRTELLDFAYEDVKRAFDYFLENHNNERPFIIASHSQGTHHALRLLAEEIDSSALHERMIAAYLIGSVLIPVSPDWFGSMEHIKPCEASNDLHCVVHWDTMPEHSEPIERPAPSLCTNPLSWQVNEEMASRDLNEGAVAPEGVYNTTMGAEPDVGTGQQFVALETPRAGHTQAQCIDGTLFVERQTDPAFSAMGSGAMNSYHGLDYALFYMNIHNNARLRATTFLGQGSY